MRLIVLSTKAAPTTQPSLPQPAKPSHHQPSAATLYLPTGCHVSDRLVGCRIGAEWNPASGEPCDIPITSGSGFGPFCAHLSHKVRAYYHPIRTADGAVLKRLTGWTGGWDSLWMGRRLLAVLGMSSLLSNCQWKPKK